MTKLIAIEELFTAKKIKTLYKDLIFFTLVKALTGGLKKFYLNLQCNLIW